MPRIRKEKAGQQLKIAEREVRFSQWPTKQNGNAHSLQFEVLTSNPWEIIRYAIIEKQPNVSDQVAPLSFLHQAQEFYRASQTFQVASKPLLLYYCLMNLAKSFILHRSVTNDINHAVHGISEDRLPSTAQEFLDSTVSVYPNSTNSPQIYALFGKALGARPLLTKTQYSVVKDILPQIVIGHRLWASAADAPERFIRIQRVRIRHARKIKSVWLTIDVQRSDLKECRLNHTQLRHLTSLDADFVEVKPRSSIDSKRYCRLELKLPIPYNRRPGDALKSLSDKLRPYLWTVVRPIPPYRRHYLYAPPPNSKVIHPILSIYAAIFYLGSVTRYRPHHFDMIAKTEYGNLVHEIIDNQILQVLFQLASEFARREVSSPAVL
jgi:hypothetical protein